MTQSKNGPNRRTLLQAGSLVLLLGTQQIARGASVVAVRIWPAQDYTRVTIESDGELKARQTTVNVPPRLTLDIEGIDLADGMRELVGKLKPDDPRVRLALALSNVAKGKGAMPPRGGAAQASDADLRAAVEFMAAAAK